MAREIHVFFEGDRKLRRAFSQFVSSLRLRAQPCGVRVLMVACKDRSRALDFFTRSLDGPKHIRGMLLVDAEAAVADACWHKPWDHLSSLGAARLSKPVKASDGHAHLMVQIMESWFLADTEMLAQHYGQGFLASRLPDRDDIESIDKSQVLRSLKDATRKSQKGPYNKGVHAPALLSKLKPTKVRAASPWCNRLFDTIEKAIEAV